MERFNVQPFLSIVAFAGRYPRGSNFDTDLLDVEERTTSASIFLKHSEACTSLGLFASTATLDKLLDLMVGDEPVKRGEVRRLLEELEGRLRDEINMATLLTLSLQEAAHYLTPRKGWEAVIENFPGAVSDIEEATKCLALSRSTACVFHLMRALEVGLRALGIQAGKLFSVSVTRSYKSH
jgi:hypothetical protein